MTKKKKKKSWKKKRRSAAIKHQKSLKIEQLQRERKQRKRKTSNRNRILGVISIILILLVLGVIATLQSMQPSNTSEATALYKLTDADFNEFSGRIVIVDCFATWCSPCVAEIPHLIEIADMYDSSEVAVISIGSSTDSEIALEQFKKEHNMDWLVARDNVGVFNKYGVQAIPTIMILDQTGNIQYQHVGLTEASILSSNINELLKD